MPDVNRSAIGEAVLAKRGKAAADSKALMNATNACARSHAWSTEQTLHANGYAGLRFAAEALAVKHGHPAWSTNALQAIRARPRDQIENLATRGAGNAEFELVLTAMVGTDPEIATVLQGESKNVLEDFVLMVKLLALAESERLKV